jgi:hypothetical protein
LTGTRGNLIASVSLLIFGPDVRTLLSWWSLVGTICS